MIYYPDEDESAKEDGLVSQWDAKPGIPFFLCPQHEFYSENAFHTGSSCLGLVIEATFQEKKSALSQVEPDEQQLASVLESARERRGLICLRCWFRTGGSVKHCGAAASPPLPPPPSCLNHSD